MTDAQEPSDSFVESLNVTVTLTSAGTSASVDGGNIKELQFDLLLHGFRGRVRIWVIADGGGDELFSLVTADDLLGVELTIAKTLYNISPAPAPLSVRATVTRRGLRELPSADVQGNPILYREYDLEFRDAAQALWSQHRPSAVYAKSTLEKVLQENTPAGVSTQLSWSGLRKTREIICLGLGEDAASFYDFLFWRADAEYGHIWYDYDAQKLVFDDAKPSLGQAEEFAFGAVEDTLAFQIHLAERPRQGVSILNTRDGMTQKQDATQPNAVTGVRRDYLVHTGLNSESKARKDLEQTRATSGRYDVRVTCSAYPEMYLAPGTLTKLGGEFSDVMFVSGESLRVWGMSLHANATNQMPEFDIENDSTEYNLTFSVDLEPEDDPRWRGPRYLAPRYPVEVEGKVLSAIGITGDRTYTVYEDPTAYGIYKVQFDTWNTTISIPVTPDFVPGHLYFPVHKDSRVFVRLEFDSARISRFLQWGKDVTVPNASQGNHLLLGKNDTSETSIKHWYVDNSPQLIIGRINSGDMGTVTVSEGLLTMEVTEEDGGTGFDKTVSVEPQAQLAKADADQDTELALTDLQTGAEGASEELGDAAEQAATAVRSDVDRVTSEVDEKANAVKAALQSVGDSVSEGASRLQEAATEAEQKIEKAFDS
jgi:hypothetical protein